MGKTKDLNFRLEALQRLRQAIASREQDLLTALKADLNKPELEAYATEIGIILSEIRFVLKRLKSWVKPRRVKTPVTLLGARSYIYPEPYGVTLIISPWNYPLQLAVSPLIGAIAAGNCAVVKPSELTPHTSAVLAELIGDIFPENYVAVVQGGADVSTALLQEKWDYIFFTGGAHIGKKVMEAASKHLTPVTLELGGKSPCFVHRDANLDLAAKRIVWGKFLNAGQTCVAPDYVYVHYEIKEDLIGRIKTYIAQFYGEDAIQNGRYTRIVNQKHFDRLTALLDSGTIRIGGKANRDKLTIEPTVLDEVSWDDPVMQEEIFGPILPILDYQDLDQALETVRIRSKPLALYVFSESKTVQDKLIRHLSFGGGCVNDTILHVASPYLPFGGVGESGMGAYHGKRSFDTFSHEKSIVKQTTLFDLPFRYPNVKKGLQLVKRFLK
ncbi:aldehyde dehydrogenase [Caldalkalibacillus thermarum]|uniref:aldehyde dehydrogenase n=1 Tax=Caldalkalibacillus thermarum TaxID=296745 RepID=UPI00166CC89C|nr:aldehyde dehydrogenase [Caldalkalibacillus thermarum]